MGLHVQLVAASHPAEHACAGLRSTVLLDCAPSAIKHQHSMSKLMRCAHDGHHHGGGHNCVELVCVVNALRKGEYCCQAMCQSQAVGLWYDCNSRVDAAHGKVLGQPCGMPLQRLPCHDVTDAGSCGIANAALTSGGTSNMYWLDAKNGSLYLREVLHCRQPDSLLAARQHIRPATGIT